jgi:hypothetical protein
VSSLPSVARISQSVSDDFETANMRPTVELLPPMLKVSFPVSVPSVIFMNTVTYPVPESTPAAPALPDFCFICTHPLGVAGPFGGYLFPIAAMSNILAASPVGYGSASEVDPMTAAPDATKAGSAIYAATLCASSTS